MGATNQVDICNRALQKLGAARITSLDDQSVNARHCKTAYDSVLAAELRDNPWSFAIQRFQLAADATAPLYDYDNAFPLPTGCLRLLSPDPLINYNDRDWVIEGNKILTNYPAPLNVRCVMLVTDTSLYDALFIEALAARLAHELAEAITQSNSKRKLADDEYKDAIRKAKRTNAIERVPEVPAEDSWVTVRNGGNPGAPGSWNASS